jgi:hypothetical protein
VRGAATAWRVRGKQYVITFAVQDCVSAQRPHQQWKSSCVPRLQERDP